jgi:RNA polymerase sigma-70 factor, ECF subfamily
MAPSRHEQDGLHSAVLAGDPTAPPGVFELLLDPLIVRLRFKWSRRPRRDLEEQAIDSILSYLERPERYEPVRANLLTYLTGRARRSAQRLRKRDERPREAHG